MAGTVWGSVTSRKVLRTLGMGATQTAQEKSCEPRGPAALSSESQRFRSFGSPSSVSYLN